MQDGKWEGRWEKGKMGERQEIIQKENMRSCAEERTILLEYSYFYRLPLVSGKAVAYAVTFL